MAPRRNARSLPRETVRRRAQELDAAAPARIAVIGIALGAPLALGATMLVRHLLFGVQPGDPLMMLGASALLVLVGLFAGLQPARRAASVDPMEALRAE